MSATDTILLIDDDRDDIEVALRAARRAALSVEIAVFHDGSQALEALGIDGFAGAGGNGHGAQRLRPRAIFLDLRMPRMNGWEVLHNLRESSQTRDIPVIVQSWSMQRADIERCYAMGANSFVAKRLTPGNPGAYFTDAVRYWVQLNETPCTATDAWALRDAGSTRR
jgi:CheY-like chemotaxis protein